MLRMLRWSAGVLCVVWFGFRICMITPNTDFTFTQVKSDNSGTFTWQDETSAEFTRDDHRENCKKISCFVWDET